MTRYARGWKQWSRVLALGLLVGACSPASPGTAPGAAPSAAAAPTKASVPAAAATADKRGGVFQIASRSAPSSLNPYVGFGLPEEITFAATVYESLLTLNHDQNRDMRVEGEVVPNLAVSWEQNSPTTYTLQLRKDVTWHDGKPFTADDVVWTFSYVFDAKNGLKARGFIPSFQGIAKVDDYAVRFTLSRPDPGFIRGLADRRTMMLPKHIAERGDTYEKVVIGTGPFKLQSYDQVSGAVLTRFDNYWDKGKPYLDGWKVLYGLDNSAQVAGFISQQLDVYSTTNKGEVDTITASVPSAGNRLSHGIFNNSLYFNLSKAPFNDIRVRRAINLAIDRQALVRGVGVNVARIGPPALSALLTKWAIPEAELLKMPGWAQPKDQEIAEAKRLLAEAGYPTGFNTTITIPSARITSGKIMEAVAGQLKQVGINMELKTTEFGVYSQAEISGNYDIVPVLIGDPESQPKPWANFLHSKGTTNPYIRDPQMDKLVEEFEGASDPKVKAQAARSIQELTYAQMYAVPTIDLPNWNVWQPWVMDYTMNWGGNAYVYNARDLWFDHSKGAPKRSL